MKNDDKVYFDNAFVTADSVFDITPTEEMMEFGIDKIVCGSCEKEITDVDYYYDGVSDHHCKKCAEKLAEELAKEAWEFAVANCKITHKIPDFSECVESIGEYDACVRHTCTDYDELIQDLNRDATVSKIYYRIIRARIEQLIDNSQERRRSEC